jgi:hypothetical protein
MTRGYGELPPDHRCGDGCKPEQGIHALRTYRSDDNIVEASIQAWGECYRQGFRLLSLEVDEDAPSFAEHLAGNPAFRAEWEAAEAQGWTTQDITVALRAIVQRIER